MKNSFIKDVLQFILSFSFTLYIITYLFKIPQYLTNQNPLVYEYYYKNFSKNIILDFVLVYLYLQVCNFVIRILKINSNILEILCVIIVTSLLTGSFCYYYLTMKKTSDFFSKWFHSVKYISIVYDVILLVFTYLSLKYLKTTVHL